MPRWVTTTRGAATPKREPNLWVCGPSSGGERQHSHHRKRRPLQSQLRRDFRSNAGRCWRGGAHSRGQSGPDLARPELILAASARKNDPTNLRLGVWRTQVWGRVRLGSLPIQPTSTGSAWWTLRRRWNQWQGTGRVPALRELHGGVGRAESAGPRRDPGCQPDEPTTVESSLMVNTSIGFVEFVGDQRRSFQHDSIRDLEIELVSPSGAVSRLAGHVDTYSDFPYIGFVPLHGTFRFGSARHLGEDPNGEWKLRVTDHIVESGWHAVSRGV